MDCQSDSNSGDEIVAQRRSSVKKVFMSDDEDDSNPLPLHTEDISLKLSDDDDDKSDKEEPNEDSGVANKASALADSDSGSAQGDLPVAINGPLHSEEERVLTESSILNKPPSSPDSRQINKSTIKHHALLDSDSDDENKHQGSAKSTVKTVNKSIWDSDSDEGESKQESPKPKDRKHLSLYDSESEEDVDDPTPVNKKSAPPKKTSAKSLYDTDSDSEPEQPKENFTSGAKSHRNGKPKNSSGPKKSRASSKDAMLAIRSESQRMTREAAVTLPYHRPKQHSLSDFLNRPRVALKSIKASAAELIEFEKRLKESEKELQEFYKSESEHSDSGDSENGNDATPSDKPSTVESANTDSKTTDEANVSVDGVKLIRDQSNTESGEQSQTDSGRASTNASQLREESSMEVDDNAEDASSNKSEVLVANPEVREFSEGVEENVASSNPSCEPGAQDANKETDELPKDVDENVANVSQSGDQIMGDDVRENSAAPESKKTEVNNEDKYEEPCDKPENKAENVRKMFFEPLSDSDDESKEKDVVKITEAKPIQLKGNPDGVIDLDDFSPHSKVDLQGFKQRFLRHSLASKPKASPTSLTVKVVDKSSDGSVLGVSDEVISWTPVDKLVDNTPPGLKMKMLKLELRRQIMEKRDQELSHKHDQEETGGDKSDCEDVDELSEKGDDDDDEEDDDADEENEESEDLVFNVDDTQSQRARQKRRQNSFVDDEADVDDDVDEDGDDEDVDEDIANSDLDEDRKTQKSDGNTQFSRKLSRTNTNVDMFASQESDDDKDIPGYQPGGGLRNKTEELLSNSPSQSTQDSSLPCTAWSAKPLDITQCTPFSSFQFGSEETDRNSPNLLGLSFGGYSGGEKDAIRNLAQSPDTPETEADLMALCSGKFTSQLPPMDSQIEGALASMADSQDSQDVQLKLDEDSPTDTDRLKAKPRGPTRMVIESSDDEDEKDEEESSKRKTKRLSFSDDEESNSVDGSDGLEEDEDPEPEQVMYDSDENEIPVKGAAFLENEAELSEDDYVGSGDEDEDVLADKMEEELGDQDDLDLDEVREEVGRIHMRKLLDEDRRDVRLMQEMLLEDGELHIDGKGRERQFRWKNIDFSTLTTTDKMNSDDEAEEDEEDVEWRKVRHAREVFLMEGLKKDKTNADIEEDDDEEDSELFRLGKVVLAKKSISRVESKEENPPKPPAVIIPESPVKSLYHSTRNSRGSFLKRTSDALTRLAEMATGKDGVVETKPKNSRNFVFSVESPPKENGSAADVKNEHRQNAKRKAKRSLAPQPDKKPCSQSSRHSSLFDLL